MIYHPMKKSAFLKSWHGASSVSPGMRGDTYSSMVWDRRLVARWHGGGLLYLQGGGMEEGGASFLSATSTSMDTMIITWMKISEFFATSMTQKRYTQ